MKAIETVTELTQVPQFWTEEWLEIAIKELDTRALTPEQRLIYETTLSANALTVRNEQKKLEEAQQRREDAVKAETVRNLLALNILTAEQIAETVEVSLDFVHKLASE